MVRESDTRQGEYELKYAFPDSMSSALASWLRFNCREDKDFPAARVQSIYYETLDMMSLSEKINSDYFKTKYRLRWYESLERQRTAASGTIKVFLERKQKIGAQRIKKRVPASAELTQLKNQALESAFHQAWCDRFGMEELAPSPRLFPFIQLSYIRKRFIDKQTGARLSLDHDIRVEKTNLKYLQPALHRKLAQGVFEIKGDLDSPPPALHFLTEHFARKTAFSKFERCVALVAL